MGNIQIDEKLFVRLIQFHLLNYTEHSEEIKGQLQKKWDSIINHNLYTKYKKAVTEDEREQARQEYLNNKGISKKFRWQQ